MSAPIETVVCDDPELRRSNYFFAPAACVDLE
jgi:hypothetical protein